MEHGARLHYVDALRVGAFALLILYHASVAFFPGMDWLVHGTKTSAALEAAMNHPRAWRLALLFFVSGMGVAFASRRVALPAFLKERTWRLGLPLLVAMAVFVVPQVWCERMYEEGYDGSLWTFWTTRYFTEGKYPQGNITWAHMWFVAYLMAILVTVVPVLKLLDRPGSKPLSRAIEKLAATPMVLALFLLPLAANLVLSPLFPHQTNSLYNDGAWFAVWAIWFAFGYLFARSHAVLVGPVIALRWTSAALAFLATLLLVLFSFVPPFGVSIGSYAEQTTLFKLLVFALAWTMILTLVGFFARHLVRPNRVIAYLNDGVFSFYIIHQTAVVVALVWLLPRGLGLWPTFGLVAAFTVAASLGFFELGRRLPGPLAAAFGIRKPSRPAGNAPIRSPDEKPETAAFKIAA